ncbi:hypothetical protein [Nocardia sp. NBC_01327]|uniref:hypothetical protein n=1 Tax=Nocardia sp. NBC_01327 TaxID=2903593 RepID=UPI002E107C35|nr:hypothetical protein OG326_22435 [Nocardia sp. NBC_01327]
MRFARRGRSTRARLRALVNRLDEALPEDWTAEELFAAVERFRGRRIVRLPLPPGAPSGLCGMWLACGDYDVFFLRDSPDPHDVLHELGHMLLGHGLDAPADELAAWLPDLGLNHTVEAVRAIRRTSSYDPPEEYEAELFATMVRTLIRADGPRRDRFLKVF